MKPITLKIDGLGSFEKEQIIDFENLTSMGLFGIFGKTGAGKSTILDSLTLALYNTISRYENNTKTDMINKNRTDCNVELVFNVNNTLYIVERRFRVDKNGELKPKRHILSEKINDEYIPIAEGIRNVDSEIEKLIGLNYNDFTKAVILPQGKFSDFVTLNSSGKREMLERIFGLEQYGKKLTDKFNIKFREIDSNYKSKKEVLSMFDEYTKENLKLIEAELEEIVIIQKFLDENLKIKTEEKIKINNEVEQSQKYKRTNEELILLENQQNEIINKEKLLNIKDVINQIKSLQEKISSESKRIEILENENKKCQADLIIVEKSKGDKDRDIDILQKSLIIDKSELSKTKIDTDFIQDINTAIQLEKNLLSVVNNMKKAEKELDNNKNIIYGLNKELQLNVELINGFEKEVEKNKSNIQRIKEEKIYWEKNQKIIQENVHNNTIISDNEEKVVVYFNEQITNISLNNENIKKYNEDINDFKIQNIAATLAEKLSDGKPCPVCGSLNHPDIVKKITAGFVEEKEKQIAKANENIKDAEMNIKKYYKVLEGRVQKYVDEYEKLEKQKEIINLSLKKAEQEIILKNEKIFNAEKDNEKLYIFIKEDEVRKADLELQLSDITNKYDLTNSFEEEYDNIQKSKEKISKLEKNIKDNEITLDAKFGESNVIQEELSDLKLKNASTLAELKEKNKNNELYRVEMKDILIRNNIDENMLDKLKVVDFYKLEDEIKVYKDRRVILVNELSKLKDYEKVDIELLMEKQKEIKISVDDIQKQIQVNTAQSGAYSEKTKNFKIKLDEKRVISKELKLLENDYNNIALLRPLLLGKKFIDFIAHKDLEEVVYFASEEFYRLSNGKYSLKLSKTSLDIEVVDNLLGGKCRGIKSLSGGETFIISLCLSLSLSKKIQMKKNSIIEFFFLDEGFGSLDNEALENITETLTRLKSDNINIGIITHVDKLKESVPKVLYVENKPNGTQVRIG